MLKITPQKCLKDFLNGCYIEKNYIFLTPVYEKLFKDIGRKINITKDFKNQVMVLKKYFSYLIRIKKKAKINFENEIFNKKDLVEKFINIIDENEIKRAVNALEKIISFLCRNRTNINGFEITAWSLFGKTTLTDIKNIFVNSTERKNSIKKALLSFDFNSLIIGYEGFSNIIINDLLMPVELKSPKRRQGLFDKEVFRLVSIEIKKYIRDFQFETDIKNLNKKV